ncbi:MAG: UPF0755 protein [Paracoccaceae bacterium]|jgi:UPF0755 protein
MRHLAANALTVLIVLGICIAGAIAWGVSVYRAPGPHGDDRMVMIPRGAGVATITEALSEAGVIGDPMIFRLGVRYSGQGPSMKFGEYSVPSGASMQDVASLLVSGRTVQHPLTVPEGWTVWQVAQAVTGMDVLEGEIESLPTEGMIAPDTYNVQRGQSRQEVIDRMVAVQARILNVAWENRAPDLPFDTKEEALVLASIIEKETAVVGERPTIGGVFVNRLRKGMRLQTDPTVIYGITKGEGVLGRGLRRSELDRRTAWNTYQIDGLPPTPIANPGKAAIAAAVMPAATDALYFVADGTGGHAFATSLAEHNRNVAAWRKIERARQAE